MKAQSYSIIIIVYILTVGAYTSGMIVYQYLHTYNDTIAGIAHTKSYPSHNILALNIYTQNRCKIRFFFLDIENFGCGGKREGGERLVLKTDRQPIISHYFIQTCKPSCTKKNIIIITCKGMAMIYYIY